jgi:dTDP-4-amino-4,6-dideoxygalactose transaminase
MNTKSEKVWLSPPHMCGREQIFVNKAFETNWVAPLGPNVDAFEESLASYCGIKHVAALNSGTSAIHLALILLGIKEGDEVIASTFTFSATINPILYLKAIPILIDSEAQTWNMSPELLEIAIRDRISKGKKPKAIIPVHLYGMPANMKEILNIAGSYEIPVVEDAAEALGSRFNNRHVGTFGLMSIFSFNGNKIITTSGGGALISNDQCLIDKARFLSTQARDFAPHYQHSHIGYNYRMSNIIAGIGCGQMEVIDTRVKQRRDNFLFYYKNLEKYKEISFLVEPNDSYFSNHWLTTILIDSTKSGKTKENLRIAMEKENIESRPLWKPMHLQPIFSSYPAYLNGISEELFDNGLCLPSGSNLSDLNRKKVLKVIMDYLTS